VIDPHKGGTKMRNPFIIACLLSVLLFAPTVFSKQSGAFRNIQIHYNGTHVVIKGEACLKEGLFFYTVEDGHYVFVEETLVKVNKKAPNWSPFSITLPKDKIPKLKNVMLVLYERKIEDGTIINETAIPLSNR
jgi:hypothetical protein